MIHVAQYNLGVEHDLMTTPALDVGDKPHAASVLFIRRVVQAALTG
jgi:hypothetical protein